MTRWTVLLCLALVACLGSRTLDDVAPTGRHGEIIIDSSGTIETVQGSDYCSDTRCGQFAPWRRTSDQFGDVRWLISANWRACMINDAQFALANSWVRRQVRCAWRSQR